MPSPYSYQSGVGGGSSSGSSGINYASTLFDGTSITGINTYNDGASAVPTDGTGGTATGLTTTLNTSVPLRGISNQRFSKDGSNRQGNGWSWDFTAAAADYEGSKPLIVTFRYRISSGYVANDLRLFAYNKDTATLLNVLSLTGDGSVGYAADATLYTASFNLADADNDYRLIFHIAGTTAAAWDFDIIDWTVTPEQTVPGAIVADLGTETWADNWNNTTVSVALTRMGNRLFASGVATITGGTTAATLSITIPSTYAPKARYYSTKSSIVGRVTPVAAGGYFVGIPFLTSATALDIYIANAGSTYVGYSGATSTIPATFANGDRIQFEVDWEVEGWSASAALSTTETMLMGASAAATGDPASAASGAPIIFPTKRWDNLTAYSTSTGRFTAPRTNRYRVFGTGYSAAAGGVSVSIYVDAVAGPFVGVTDSNGEFSYGGVVEANAGQLIDLRPNGTLDLQTGSTIYFEEIFSPTVFSVYGATALYPATGYSSGGLVNYVTTAGQYGDLDSEVLQPGEYDAIAQATYYANGAVTTSDIGIGISTTTGNSATGLTKGETYNVDYKVGTTTTHNHVSVTIQGIVVTTPTTYYLKSFAAVSITNLQIGWSWRFRAVKKSG